MSQPSRGCIYRGNKEGGGLQCPWDLELLPEQKETRVLARTGTWHQMRLKSPSSPLPTCPIWGLPSPTQAKPPDQALVGP